jgi:phage terminase small subunit
MMMENQLNKQQLQFVDEVFLNKLNYTIAYQKAYGCTYDSANASAFRLLANVSIQNEIEKRYEALQQKHNVDTDLLMCELKLLLDKCKIDDDRSNLIKIISEMGKMIGSYKQRIEHSGSVAPIQINIIQPSDYIDPDQL